MTFLFFKRLWLEDIVYQGSCMLSSHHVRGELNLQNEATTMRISEGHRDAHA
jgi:hypothetical protein